MSDVFISYSRLDKDFVGKLREALAEHDQDVWIDWESIPESRVWWEEIKKGIARANNFAVILSLNSMASPICQMEIEYAIELNKRIIPVYYNDFDRKAALVGITERLADPDQNVTREIWENRQSHTLYDSNDATLKRINYFFFKADDDFEIRFHDLLTIIHTDYDHKEQHTTLELRAQEWQRRNKDSGFLLIDNELTEAQLWLEKADVQNKTPVPTELHREYIAASERRTRQLRNIRWAGILAGFGAVIGIIASLLAGASALDSVNIASTADAMANHASTSEANAILQANNAETEVAIAATAEQNAQQQAENAEAQVIIAGETLTPVPVTLDALATKVDEGYRFQMAGWGALRQTENENDGLAFAFEAVGLSHPPDDVLPLFYEIAGQSSNVMTLTGHTDSVKSVAFSPDSQLLASSGNDNHIILWDVASGMELVTLIGHTNRVNSVVFSPDGTILASASNDGSIKLWDTQTYEEITSLLEDTGQHDSVAFSPAGDVLISYGGSGLIRIWDMYTYSQIHTLRGDMGQTNTVTFHPQGHVIATTSDGTVVTLWNIESGEKLSQFVGHTGRVNGAAFSPDGQILATSSSDSTIKLWDVAKGNVISTLHGHTNNVRRVRFSPDGQILASSSLEDIKLWDVATGNEITTLIGHTHWVWDIAFSPDGEYLASASYDNSVRLWHSKSTFDVVTLNGHTDEVKSITYSPDGSIIASGSADTTVKLWDAQTGDQITSLESHSGIVQTVRFSPDGQTLGSVDDDLTVRLWDVTSGNEIDTFSGFRSIAFSPIGETIALSREYDIVFRDLVTGNEVISSPVDSGKIDILTFSPDGELLASVNNQIAIKLWDPTTGEDLNTMIGRFYGIAFSPDGQILASSGSSGYIELWDVADGTIKTRLPLQIGTIFSVAYHPDGQMIATGNFDGSIQIWSMNSDDEVITLRGHTDYVYAMAFSPDGTTLVSASRDGTIRLWNISSLPLMRQWVQDNRYIREFTCEERIRFNMPAQCDDEGGFPTRTPYPTPSPIPLPSWTPFWTPQPTATSTPLPEPVPLLFLTATAEAGE